MKKPYFILRSIDCDVIDKKYGFEVYYQDKHPQTMIGSSSPEHDDDPSSVILSSSVTNNNSRTTRITDLSIKEKDDGSHFSFLDESKRDHQCVVTMKSYLTNENFPLSTILHCFWCRHGFSYRPIGCPIDYVPNRLTKRYFSEITRDKYILRENATFSQIEQTCEESLRENQDGTIPVLNQYELLKRDYYLMDGLFCSFNCCLAFIRSQNSTPLYLNSEHLLTKIYYDLFGADATPLVPAPSWRLLQEYGGHMTIEEFRKNFYKIDYFNIDNVLLPFPNAKPVGFLFEKQIKL